MSIYTLDGKSPELPETFHWIAPTAVVIGNVSLKEGGHAQAIEYDHYRAP